MGYASLWIGDVGGDVFGAAERLLAATSSIVVATGVLNLWKHSAEETTAQFAGLSDQYANRFLLGIGVSHRSIIDEAAPGRYRRPLVAMNRYLDQLDEAVTPVPRTSRVLAALGPKMLQVAAERAAGAHPYNVPPEHTATAREALGPEALLLPEQAVALTTDAATARALGREHISHHLTKPNYVNNWRRLGFDDDDFVAGGSNRLVDSVLAWGDEEAIRRRVVEHYDAGATQVCVQVLSSGDRLFPTEEWRRLGPALTDLS